MCARLPGIIIVIIIAVVIIFINVITIFIIIVIIMSVIITNEDDQLKLFTVQGNPATPGGSCSPAGHHPHSNIIQPSSSSSQLTDQSSAKSSIQFHSHTTNCPIIQPSDQSSNNTVNHPQPIQPIKKFSTITSVPFTPTLQRSTFPIYIYQEPCCS